MTNVIDFYLGLKNDEEHIASKEYQLLKENKIDTALLDGVDPDENAGGVELGKVTDGETNILVDDVVDFVKSMPKDMLLSVTRGGMNAFGFVNSLTNLVGVNPDSSYEFAKDKIDNQLKRLDELDKDSPLVSKMLAVVGQDAAFIYPAYKKFKSLGIPKQYSLPLAFGVGQSLAFNKDQSMFVDTDAVNSLKRYINIEPGSSADDMVDNALLAIEGSSLGYLFDKLGPVLKGIKNSNWQQNAVAVGGATAAAAVTEKAVAGEKPFGAIETEKRRQAAEKLSKDKGIDYGQALLITGNDRYNIETNEYTGSDEEIKTLLKRPDLSSEAIKATNEAARKSGEFLREQGIETNYPEGYDLDPKAR
tara:strand:+ start:1626 stop:2711 length:1086 start_codon:yes stop_codon:yes gene_type:complete